MIRDHEIRRQLPRSFVIGRGVVALVLLAGAIWLLMLTVETRRDVGLRLSLLGIYLFIAFWIDPEPDYNDLGWFGGLMNDPFRFRDNINRSKLSWRLFLAPGAFIATGVWDLLRMDSAQPTLPSGSDEPER